MARLSLIRSDADGLYVRAGGYTARPGAVTGFSHVWRMDDGGLNAGDRVVARHIAQTPIVQLRLADGTVLRWHTAPHPTPPVSGQHIPLPSRPVQLRRA